MKGVFIMLYNNSYGGWSSNQDRFFPAAPFLLGALTGGVAAAAFNPYRPRPFYPAYPMQPYYYGPPYYY